MDPQDLPGGPDDTTGVPGVEPHEAGPALVLGGHDGLHALGPATIDSDADGAADTALVPPPPTAQDHELFSLATDLDHDGDVDVLTTVSADGCARTVVVEPGEPSAPAWDPGWDGPPPPAAVLDPATGAWTRSV